MTLKGTGDANWFMSILFAAVQCHITLLFCGLADGVNIRNILILERNALVFHEHILPKRWMFA